MALTTCKTCNSSISTDAKNCPGCGAKIIKKTSPITWLIAAFLFFCVVPPLISNLDPSDNSTMAYIMVKKNVTANLVSPSTAEFPSRSNEHVKRTGDVYYIDSWVDSQNRFGATLRNHFTAEIEQTGPNSWQLKSLVMN